MKMSPATRALEDTSRSSLESRAVDRYHRIAKKYDGTLDGKMTASLLEELRSLVPPGSYVGLFGLIRVRGLSFIPEGGLLTDVKVEWNYTHGSAGPPMDVIHFLEHYRRFDPHLV